MEPFVSAPDELLQLMRPTTSGKIVLDPAWGQVMKRKETTIFQSVRDPFASQRKKHEAGLAASQANANAPDAGTPTRGTKKVRKPGTRVPRGRAAAGSRANKRLRTVGSVGGDTAPTRQAGHGMKPDHKSRAIVLIDLFQTSKPAVVPINFANGRALQEEHDHGH